MIEYTNNLEHIDETMLYGFFVGWYDHPSESGLLKILKGSFKIWLALDTENHKVVGFITAISDGVLSSYIPLFEVLPHYQHRGIGKKLFSLMKESLKDMYMIDVMHDEELSSFYARQGMGKAIGSIIRNYERQTIDRIDIK